jgi:hypothetical protein
MDTALAGATQQTVKGFSNMKGANFSFGDFAVTLVISMLFLALTAVLFFGLSMIFMRKKQIG